MVKKNNPTPTNLREVQSLLQIQRGGEEHSPISSALGNSLLSSYTSLLVLIR